MSTLSQISEAEFEVMKIDISRQWMNSLEPPAFTAIFKNQTDYKAILYCSRR